MSLEAALEKNTAAVLALTAAYLDRSTTPAATAAEQPAAPKTDKPAPKTDKPALTYAIVGAVVSSYVKANGRAAAEALLAKHGLKLFTETKEKPELWGPVLATFEAATA